MLKDIIEVKALEDYHVHLRFEDGSEGVLDIKSLVDFDGVFEPLADPEYFAKVAVNPDLGTVGWPNGADLDPDVLYSAVTGEALPEPEAASTNNPDD